MVDAVVGVLECTPVIGYAVAGVHAATGNTKRAKKAALCTTKSTVVAAAGLAGLACGPAAAVCGASFALGANAAWDVGETLITGETTGVVKFVRIS